MLPPLTAVSQPGSHPFRNGFENRKRDPSNLSRDKLPEQLVNLFQNKFKRAHPRADRYT